MMKENRRKGEGGRDCICQSTAVEGGLQQPLQQTSSEAQLMAGACGCWEGAC